VCCIAPGLITYPKEGDAFNCHRAFFNFHAEAAIVA